MKCRIVMGLVVLSLGIGHSAEEEKKWFVDRNLVYERGSALSEEYLGKHAPEFSRMLETITPWVVRMEVRHSYVKNGYRSNHGTGIILNGGQILTAKHVLNENAKEGEKKIILTMTDGRVLPAEVMKEGEKDWTMLRITRKESHEAAMKSPVVIGKVRPKETAVFLGYPARLGLDEKGKVKSFYKGDETKGNPVSKLSPLLVVTTVSDPEAMKLKPLAGFPPVGGMSGGPILNAEGKVIGVQNSVSKTTEDATGKVLYYTINATPASEVVGER
jgi:S1-C subfamily serine protease